MEIKKLADIVEWADGIIRDCGYYEEKYNSDAATAYCNVKAYELWRIRDVVLDGMQRHAVYTNALNQDIVAKDAKIDLMQKELEGRKEGYYALKEKYDVALANKNEEIEKLKKSFNALKEEMATRYITIETHNSIYETYDNKIAELEKELADCKVKIRHQKENLDGINKTLEIRTKENERLIAVKKNKDKEIEAHESENKRLSEKIMSMHNTITELTHDIDNYQNWNANLHMDIKEWKATADANGLENQRFRLKIVKLEEENEKLKVDLMHEREKNEKLAKDHAELENDMRKVSKDRDGYREEAFKAVNQERIRTDQLRATESKVEELWEEIERLRDLGEHWKRSYFNIRYSLNKLKDESKEDDYGRSGFKRYIEHLIEEEERAVPERFKERLNKEITAIFTKEEETKVKGNGRTNSGRYPWGAKVNDIPCGEDAIE